MVGWGGGDGRGAAVSTPAPRTLRAAFCRLADDIEALVNRSGMLDCSAFYEQAKPHYDAVQRDLCRLDRMIRQQEGAKL